MQIFYTQTIPSPVGALQLIASDRGLCALLLPRGRVRPGEGLVEAEHPILLKAEKQLGEYFAGKRKKFDVKLDMQGTVFQIKAWRELEKIPYGETISYGEQAKRMGDAKKSRAVGMANGRNPIAIIVPCHRVIGSNGSLTGFGGGLHMKQQLIDLERQAAIAHVA